MCFNAVALFKVVHNSDIIELNFGRDIKLPT